MAFRLSSPGRPDPRIAALAFGILAAVLVPGVASGQSTGPFTLEPLPATAARGAAFTVHGSGCAPTGAYPADHPVYLYLTPPTGGNSIGPGLINGNAGVFMTLIGIDGEVEAHAMPDTNGSFTASIPVPDNAPIAPGYTVRAICLTGLVGDAAGPGGITQASYDAAFATVGTLEVQAAPSTATTAATTATTSTTSTTSPPPAVRPTFTG